MGALNFLAGLAAIVLAIELVVLVFILAAICAGVWYGLRFADRKATPAFNKVNEYVDRARGYERTGLRYAVKPFIALHVFGESVGVTLSDLIERSRR